MYKESGALENAPTEISVDLGPSSRRRETQSDQSETAVKIASAGGAFQLCLLALFKVVVERFYGDALAALLFAGIIVALAFLGVERRHAMAIAVFTGLCMFIATFSFLQLSWSVATAVTLVTNAPKSLNLEVKQRLRQRVFLSIVETAILSASTAYWILAGYCGYRLTKCWRVSVF